MSTSAPRHGHPAQTRTTTEIVPRVFINYRSDAAAWAVMLDEALTNRFGTERIFRASRSIRASEDFIERILASVRSCSVLLAVIGPTWLTAEKNGRRRIDDTGDWVRREITEALNAGVPIIPILTDDAAPLAAADLPADIAALGRAQYIRLHHRNITYDLQRIVDELTRLVPDLRAAPAAAPTDAAPPSAVAAEFEPSAEQVWQWAEKLAALRTMIDDGARQQVVESLPLAVALRIRRHTAVLPDVHAILTQCLEHEDALDVLLAVVRRLEGPTRRMRELDAMLGAAGIGHS